MICYVNSCLVTSIILLLCRVPYEIFLSICYPDRYLYLTYSRRQKVLLDRDVAMLYGVETKRVNEAVRNNPDKFPKDYIIELNESEIRYLRSKFSTTNLSSKVRAIPKAFTEKGLYMLATVLKSPRATATTLAIIESFAHLRELSRNLNILSTETDEGKQKTLTQRSSELLHELLSVEEKGDTNRNRIFDRAEFICLKDEAYGEKDKERIILLCR